LPVPFVDDAPILLTGSYDEGLRVYHATRRGEVLAEQGLGGGVWRLQLLNTKESGSERQFLVLASCMHAGTRIVRITQREQDQTAEWEIDVLAEFTEHESMNYASDVWKGSTTSDLLCVSSSFYDRRVCVWRAVV
jgi:diphthamide biosynthesis protein 7